MLFTFLLIVMFIFAPGLSAQQITYIDSRSFHYDIPDNGRLDRHRAMNEINMEVARAGFHYYAVIDPADQMAGNHRRGFFRYTVIMCPYGNPDRFGHEMNARGILVLYALDHLFGWRYWRHEPRMAPPPPPPPRHGPPGRTPPPRHGPPGRTPPPRR